MKMSYHLLVLLCLQITLIHAAPLLLLPVPWMPQNDMMMQQMLQKQLMELQALKQLNVPSPFQINNPQQPLVVVLPNEGTSPNIKLYNENDHNIATRTKLENEDDLNSIVIDAEEGPENQATVNTQPPRAILLVPNGRLSLGDIISSIPWLPIEINVPDTIGWAYNGIASGIGSIISIIGRPFQSTSQAPVQDNLRTLLKQIKMRNQNAVRPIIMMPIDGPVLPIQV